MTARKRIVLPSEWPTSQTRGVAPPTRRFASLDFAANPASRLFGGRAVARGPAFKVEIAYRDGAEDRVSARVASRLADLNSFQGVV